MTRSPAARKCVDCGVATKLSDHCVRCAARRLGRRKQLRSLEEKREVTPSGCWLWTGHTRKDGYGLCYSVVPRKRQTFVHRVSYETYVGPIPDGFSLHHTCEIRNCFNPAHLVPVTHAEHMKIHRSETCPRCGHSDFTEWDHSCRECHRRRARARYQAKKAKT